jgi:ribosomal protein L7/L12
MPTRSIRRRKVKLSPDHVALLSAFNEHKVRYLVVGGYAVGFHSEPRATKDLDVYIRVDEENSHAVFRALASFGAPLSGLSPADFNDGKSFFIMGFPPERIDVLQEIDGVTFDECWASRITAIVNSNLEIPVISAQHLVANKLAAGRPRDLLDVEDIREAQLEKQRDGATINLTITGWNIGFKKIACTKLFRTELGLGLSDAKEMTDAIKANQTVMIEISELRSAGFSARLQELGVKTVKVSPTNSR